MSPQFEWFFFLNHKAVQFDATFFTFLLLFPTLSAIGTAFSTFLYKLIAWLIA